MALKPTAAAIAAAAIAACAAEQPPGDIAAAAEAAQAGEATKDIHPAGKPGAAVEVSAVQRTAVEPGEIGVVEFVFIEDYASGTMTVTASGSDGLEILPVGPKTTMSMVDKSEHRWDVSFRASAAGAYYIDLLIVAAGADETPEARSFSTRVTVGAPAAATKPAEQPAIINGDPVVIMEADETVDG